MQFLHKQEQINQTETNIWRITVKQLTDGEKLADTCNNW